MEGKGTNPSGRVGPLCVNWPKRRKEMKGKKAHIEHPFPAEATIRALAAASAVCAMRVHLDLLDPEPR